MRAKELLEDPVVEDELPEALGILVSQVLKRSRAEAWKKDTGTDRLLPAKEAAARLGVSKSWLYQRTPTLPFAVKQGRKVGYSERGIEEYISKNMGK